MGASSTTAFAFTKVKDAGYFILQISMTDLGLNTAKYYNMG